MADTSVGYKCPNCGGPLAYTPGKGDKIKCEYCDTEFSVKALDEMFAQAREMAAEAEEAQKQKWEREKAENEWTDEDISSMQSMVCSSCGAEIVMDGNTMATECCYCGNPTMVPGRFKGGLKPDYVIPFTVTKEEAKAKLAEFSKGKWLLPNNFLSASRIEHIQGMYVPFWLFDASVNGSATFEATNSKSWDSGDDTITETDHYKCARKASMSFTRVPSDGSQKMDDTYMQSIEPYNYEGMVEFNTTYMAGYLADKYDVEAEACIPVIDERILNTVSSKLKETVTGYDSVSLDSCNINKQKSSVSYAMAPVWILTNQYNGQKYTYMVNGQTGKMVGHLPIDKGKRTMYRFAAALLSLPITYYVGKFAANMLL